MGDDANPVEEGEAYRWRPTVAPFRAGGMRRVRARRPLPGQMSLPGIESSEEPPPTDERDDDEGHRVEGPEPPRGGSTADAATPGLTCPHCGGTEFDEDGDCIRCWEPGVAPGGGAPENDRG